MKDMKGKYGGSTKLCTCVIKCRRVQRARREIRLCKGGMIHKLIRKDGREKTIWRPLRRGKIILKWTIQVLYVKICRLHLHGLGETRVDAGLNLEIHAYLTVKQNLKALLKR